MTSYNITYLFSQALGVFALRKLMSAFFEKTRVSRLIEAALFVAYYILTSSVYLVINIPLVNFIFNILAVFSLTFLYSSSIKKKILVGLLVYVISVCTEMVVVTLTGYINFPITEANNYNSIFGVVSANVLLFIISTAANSFKSIKNGDHLPKAYWAAIFTVPFLSLYILAEIFQSEGLTVYAVSSSVAAILIINFMDFFLFDRISFLYKEQQESALVKQQNEYYVNQLLLVEELHEKTGKLRHDIKNHLITINSYLEKDKTDEAKKHISNIIGTYQNKIEIVHTGFPAIDGLMNSKLRSAYDAGVKINIKTSLPLDFCFFSFDLTVILGNLLDNALQAVSAVEGDKFIDIRIDCSRGMLLIKMSNPFSTVMQKENGKIVTSNPDKGNHGFGLRNIDEILKKYNGTSKIDIDNGVFNITTALYIK